MNYKSSIVVGLAFLAGIANLYGEDDTVFGPIPAASTEAFGDSLGEFRTSPRVETPNLVVWEKDLGNGRRLVLERAYMYSPDVKSRGGGVFQFAFVLISSDTAVTRQILWTRLGEEFASTSGAFPNPELRVLDVAVHDKHFLVLFNQYYSCYAFRVKRDKQKAGQFETEPFSMNTTKEFPPSQGAICAAAEAGEIQVSEDQVSVRCRGKEGWKTYQLTDGDSNNGKQWKAVD